MKLIVIGIFDRKSQSFISMEPTPAIGVAARQFTEVVNKPSDNAIYKWPEDHELYELGVFDSETGMIQARSSDDCEYEKRLIIAGDAVKVRN